MTKPADGLEWLPAGFVVFIAYIERDWLITLYYLEKHLILATDFDLPKSTSGGRPLSQGVPSCRFAAIHPLRSSLHAKEFRALRSATRGAAP